jgi:hypothetical protein
MIHPKATCHENTNDYYCEYVFHHKYIRHYTEPMNIKLKESLKITGLPVIVASL